MRQFLKSVKFLYYSGWPLAWKSGNSGKSQGKWKRVKIVREKSGNLRKREESQGKVREFEKKSQGKVTELKRVVRRESVTIP